MLITLRNVEKSYPHGVGRTYVLRRINADIKEGEFVSIMGPSGAGKSTLLHILGMHDSAWSGEYYFMDQPVHRLNPKQRAELHKKHIGFVFQSYHLLDNLTVYENLEIPLSYRNVSRKDRQSMVADILDRFQIVGKKDLYPNQLSGGQQQLVGVAREVIAPRVLIADDQPDVLEALRLLLKTEGYKIDSAGSPAAVLEAIDSQEYDAVLMDLNYTRDTTSGQEG